MKKFLILFLIGSLCFLQFAPTNVAEMKTKLSYSKITMVRGSDLKLRVMNKGKGNVDWISGNNKKVKISKKGVVTAKKLGIVTVYAKYKSRKYKCKIVVKALKKGNNMKINNMLFTEDVYKNVVRVDRIQSEKRVVSPEGIYKIYTVLAESKMKELPQDTPLLEGGVALKIILKNRTEMVFTVGSLLMVNGKMYSIPSGTASKISELWNKYAQ